MDKKLDVVFAPGCFDSFEGSQEELQELMAEIHRLVDSGEIFEQAVPVDELDAEDIEMLENAQNRNLQ